MQIIFKSLLALLVLAIAAQQLKLYYDTVVVGNYVANAAIGSTIVTGVIWPLAVIALTVFAIRMIYTFDPKSIN